MVGADVYHDELQWWYNDIKWYFYIGIGEYQLAEMKKSCRGLLKIVSYHMNTIMWSNYCVLYIYTYTHECYHDYRILQNIIVVEIYGFKYMDWINQANCQLNKIDRVRTQLHFLTLVNFHLITSEIPRMALLPIFCVISMNISLRTAVHGAVLCVMAFKIMLFESQCWWSLQKLQ